MTLSILTSNITLSFVYAECRVFDIVILSVIMLSVIMLRVIMLSVIMLSVILLNIIMLTVMAPFVEQTNIIKKAYNRLFHFYSAILTNSDLYYKHFYPIEVWFTILKNTLQFAA